MTVITFPIEIQKEVYAITGMPPAEVPIEITIKWKETLSNEVLEKLKLLGVRFMTPVKLNEELPTGSTST